MQEIKQIFQELIEEIKCNQGLGLDKLIEFYRDSSVEQKEFIRKNIDNEVAGLLISYSHKAAVESVRQKSSKVLFNGFLAQSIEDSRGDYRDNVIELFLLYNSAKRLGEDARSLVKRVASMSSKEFSDMLLKFIDRKDLDMDIVKLSGYGITEEPEFDYVWKGCEF